jgi:hypothetical protein
MRFAQANEAAMRDLTAAADFIKRTDTLAVHWPSPSRGG